MKSDRALLLLIAALVAALSWLILRKAKPSVAPAAPSDSSQFSSELVFGNIGSNITVPYGTGP